MVQHSSTNLTETNKSWFAVGTVLEYHCDHGYVSDGPTVLACSALGRWSSEPPRCIRSDGKDNLIAPSVLQWLPTLALMATCFFCGQCVRLHTSQRMGATPATPPRVNASHMESWLSIFVMKATF